MDPIQLRFEVFRELVQYHVDLDTDKLIEQTLRISRAIEQDPEAPTSKGER